ncbi:hypothetical protein SH2C18_51180 [Clostridium sediminicola]|uniref:hypothetical protein n=1 Tax=Clostridium sediminicola TaxID=3114879 RepID=UPI0031F27C08
MLINIIGNSFLVNMKRFIVGTLMKIGPGQKNVILIDDSFTTLNREHIGHKTMTHPLCLMEISYK